MDYDDSDEIEVTYKLSVSEDKTTWTLIVEGRPMTDVDYIACLKTFCFDAERNICEDGENIAFDADENYNRH